MEPLLHPPDSARTGLGPTHGTRLQIQGGVWGPMTVSSQDRQATRPAASPPPLGTPAYGTRLGSQRHNRVQATQERKGTAFSWQAHLPQGLALLPGFPALAEWIDPEATQEGPSLGLHCLCPRFPQGPETLRLLGSSDWEGQLLLVACAHARLLWGPWPPACLTISPPLRAWRQSQVRQLLPWAQAGPGPRSHPAADPCPQGPARKLRVHCLGRLPLPSQLEGSGDQMGDQSVQEVGVRGRAGQEEREVRCRHSQTRQGVCAVFAFRAGKSMSDGGSEVANLVGQPTRAVLP